MLDPSFTIAVALLAGLVAQVVATHLRVPGIVLLLATGVLLGPSVAGLIQPDTLGASLGSIVAFAVAVILFEGGMNLDIPRIRHAEAPIRRLLTLGVLVTAIGGTLAAALIMQWSWSLAFLFGTLVIVTGPTVVTPLLRRLRVQHDVATILEAEGVLIDPIGAIIASVALEIVIHPSVGGFWLGVPHVTLRLVTGLIAGVVGGWLISRVLRVRRLIPEGLTNVFTLSAVFALFQIVELGIHESGIAAVTAAGMTVRYLGTPVERELLEFKEQLTVMLIGLLFVLLAADVRLADVEALGWPGLMTVAFLMLVVRPLAVLLSAHGTDLDWRQQAFMAWTAPRGIVAAAVASLFAVSLNAAGLPGGDKLRALVFLVIAVTVVTSGLTGGLVASLLGVRRPTHVGWVVLGAHTLAREVGRSLISRGEEVLLIDVNPETCRMAEAEGIPTLIGNALTEGTLERADLDSRLGAIGLTRNEEVNFLFVQRVRRDARLEHLYVSLSSETTGLTPDMVHHGNASILFGGAHEVERWAARLHHGTARVVRCTYCGAGAGPDAASPGGHAVPLVCWRGDRALPVSDQTLFRQGDEVDVVIDTNFEREVLRELEARGFAPMTAVERDVKRQAVV